MKKDEKQDKKKESNEDNENNSEDNKERYKPMTDKEVKQLAEDIYKGVVFTDRHIRIKEELPSVFMALVFMKEEQTEELRKNPPGMIYEYMEKAGPRAVNGNPTFLSFRMISKDDAKKVLETHNKILEVVGEV
jgi:HEPN domain-containing protein